MRVLAAIAGGLCVVAGLWVMCGPVRLHWGLERHWILFYEPPRVLLGLTLLVAGAAMLYFALLRPANLAVVGGILTTVGVGIAVVAPLWTASLSWFLDGFGSLSLLAIGVSAAGGWLLAGWVSARRGRTGRALALVMCVLVAIALLGQPATGHDGGATLYNARESNDGIGYFTETAFGVENTNVSYGSPVLALHDVNLVPATADVRFDERIGPITGEAVDPDASFPRPTPADTATPVGTVPMTVQQSFAFLPPSALGVTVGIDVTSHGEYSPCASPHPFYVAIPAQSLDLVDGGSDRVVAVEAVGGGAEYAIRLAEGPSVVVRRIGEPLYEVGDAVEVIYIGPPSDYGEQVAGGAPAGVKQSIGEVYESVCAVDQDLWQGLWLPLIYVLRLVVLGAIAAGFLVGGWWNRRPTG